MSSPYSPLHYPMKKTDKQVSRSKIENSTYLSLIYVSEQCKFVEGHKRRDCGHYGITKNQCMDKGCCWSPVKGKYKNKHPWCHHSEGQYLFVRPV